MPTKAVSVGTSAVLMVDETRNRTAIMLANPDPSGVLYISDEKDKCTTSQAMPIFPFTYVMLSAFEGVDTESKWWVISDTAAKNIRVIEFYGKSPSDIVPQPNNRNGKAKYDPLTTWDFSKVMKV